MKSTSFWRANPNPSPRIADSIIIQRRHIAVVIGEGLGGQIHTSNLSLWYMFKLVLPDDGSYVVRRVRGGGACDDVTMDTDAVVVPAVLYGPPGLKKDFVSGVVSVGKNGEGDVSWGTRSNVEI